MSARRVLGTLAALALGAALGLLYPAQAPGDEADPAGSRVLSAAEVTELLSGNTEMTESLRNPGTRWKQYANPDGSIRGLRNERRLTGKWFVDPVGRSCIRWEDKGRTKCDQILREGDAYVRVRDGERVARFTTVAGNPDDL